MMTRRSSVARSRSLARRFCASALTPLVGLVMLGCAGRLIAGCAAGGTTRDTEPVTDAVSSTTSAGGGQGGDEASAASSSSAGEGGAGGQGGGAPCAMGCSAGLIDLDGDAATGECGCEYACSKVSDDDPLDAAFTDDNCDGSDGVVADCVFVSKKLGSAMGDGTRKTPLDTIDAALKLAQGSGKKAVCLAGVAGGEIHDGAVTLVSGVSLYGGFDAEDATFVFRRSEKVSTVLRAEGLVVLANAIDVDTHVEGLELRALKTPLFSGTTYGVRLVSGKATLFVRYNTITVEAGGDGQPGFEGSAPSPTMAPKGADGSNGCTGSDCGYGGAQGKCLEYGGKGGDGGYDSNGGNAGAPGSGGAPTGSGGSGSNCFGGGNNGGVGGSVNVPGTSGDPGVGGKALGTVNNGAYVVSDGSDGTLGKNGKGGSGGGGGGGGDNASGFCKSDKGGGGGAGGCGGLGGDRGRGGKGGGGSFAVFADEGSVQVVGNELSTAGGGSGGSGGTGGGGQLGGGAGKGGSDADDSGSGGDGGSGSAGGPGGPGGGGGGGPSACVAHALASVTFKQNSCKVGPGGLGGKGGVNVNGVTAASGANGASDFVLALP
ncbi:MAG: PE-PGRS family protein [Deltaproteobacteria bacterium]|nr:PE-PGRS family protein [Deltaproteobacteria bacterium]